MMRRTAIHTIVIWALVCLFGFAATGQSIDIQYLNSTLWSRINDVTVRDNYAFCAMQHGLLVYDISMISNPVPISKYYLDSGEGMGLKIVGNLAYMCSGRAGLQIINIANPYDPQFVGEYVDPTWPIKDVVIDGNYAYLADSYKDMDVLDISNPAAPVLVGTYVGEHTLTDMHVRGDHLFCADLLSMKVINITDPSAPFTEFNYNAAGIRSLDMVDTLAYGLTTSSMHVINIADPTNPVEVGSLDFGFSSYSVRGIEVIGDYAYTYYGPYDPYDGSGGNIIVDVSDPTSPVIANQLQKAGYVFSPFDGDLGIGDGISFFDFLDLNDPVNPTIIGSIPVPHTRSWGLRGIVTDGNYAYAAFGPSDVQIVDVSDPASPEPVIGDLLPGGAYELELRNKLLYVASGSYDGQGLYVIDVSSPTDPSIIGYYAYSSPQEVTLSGDYAFVAGNSGNSIILDVSDPTNPSLVATYRSGGITWGIAVHGDYAYLANFEGLITLSIGDIANPIVLDTLVYQYRNFFDVTMFDDYLVTSGNGFVKVFDLSIPSEPAELVDIPIDGDVRGLTRYGDYIMAAGGISGFNVIDMSVPTSPAVVAEVPMSGEVQAVAFFDEHAFVVDQFGFVSYAVDLPTCCFDAGDVNFDGQANISDAVSIIDRVFRGGLPPTCPASSDANCDGVNNISDAVHLVNWIFRSGAEPCCP